MVESAVGHEPLNREADGASPISPIGPTPPGRPLWPWLSVLLVVFGVLGFSVDLPAAEFCFDKRVPGFFRDLLHVAEVFGNGMGATIIVGVVLLLDPKVIPAAPRIITATLGSGIASNVGKLVIARFRPTEFRRTHDLDTSSVWETFDGWFPLFGNTAATQGFPSSHTATAFGLAIALSWRYPRGRYLFYTLAVLVGCQRVEVGMHFVSDVCLGGALGWTMGCLCIYGPQPAKWFSAWEARFAKEAGDAHTLRMKSAA